MKNAQIFVCGYLSVPISKQFCKSFEEQIMSKDKYHTFISHVFLSFGRGIFSYVMCLDQSYKTEIFDGF